MARKHRDGGYDIVRTKPAAKFYYQGKHSHPVRRTVLVIEDLPEALVGYEIREGNVTRNARKAPVKTYRKDCIARYGDYSRLPNPENKRATQTTLRRTGLFSLLKEGV